MGVMTINAIHPLGHYLFMHIGSQSFFGMAFITNAVLIQLQQRGEFGTVWQMAGRTVSHLHGTMDETTPDKSGVAHHTEFLFGTNQTYLGLKIMTITAFFFIIGLVAGDGSLRAGQLCRQFLPGLQSQIFLHLLFMILRAQLIHRRKAGHPLKDRGQDLVPGNLVASGEHKAEEKNG
jgi:hypothetical protein